MRLTSQRFLACALIMVGPALAANEAPKPILTPAPAGSGPMPDMHFTPGPSSTGPRPDMRPAGKDSGPAFGVASVQNPRFGVNFKPVWGEFKFYLPQLTGALRARWKQMVVPKSPSDARGESIAITFAMNSDGVVDGTTVHIAGTGTDEDKDMCKRVLLACSPYQPWSPAMIQKLGKSQELTVIFSI